MGGLGVMVVRDWVGGWVWVADAMYHVPTGWWFGFDGGMGMSWLFSLDLGHANGMPLRMFDYYRRKGMG